MKPRRIVEGIEESAALPSGKGDRFAGYALIGLPFRSGHILALRRFPVSSLGPGYTSIWHRDPVGHWTFYSTVPPEQSCSRYFGRPIEGNVHAQIQLAWIGSHHFRVTVADERPLTWDVVLGETVPSRLMNTAARLVPESWWQKQFMLRAMGLAAEIFLSAGKVNLAGRTPNGQDFIANPLQIWLVMSSHAIVNGEDLGPVGPLNEQARLNEFFIPQRGLFAVARSFLENTEEAVLNESLSFRLK